MQCSRLQYSTILPTCQQDNNNDDNYYLILDNLHCGKKNAYSVLEKSKQNKKLQRKNAMQLRIDSRGLLCSCKITDTLYRKTNIIKTNNTETKRLTGNNRFRILQTTPIIYCSALRWTKKISLEKVDAAQPNPFQGCQNRRVLYTIAGIQATSARKRFGSDTVGDDCQGDSNIPKRAPTATTPGLFWSPR
jgi:hypothetical protein